MEEASGNLGIQWLLERKPRELSGGECQRVALGHRIAILRGGDLQQVGTPLEVYDRPANLFVAGFIGTPPMSLLPATLTGDGALLTGAGCRIPVPEAFKAAAGPAGRKLVLGLRPECVAGPERPAAAGAVGMQVLVEMLETLGDEVIVHTSHGTDTRVFKADPHRAPETGALDHAVVVLRRTVVFPNLLIPSGHSPCHG